MLSGLCLSYQQRVLLHLPVYRGSVFCLCVHSSSLLCPVFYTSYSVLLFVVHPCAGSPSSIISALSASMCPSRSIAYLLSSSFPTWLCRFPSTSVSKSSSVLPCPILQGYCSMPPILF
ncbi:unnamed protein product [Heterobilharzia americana]|nr:unnamed protein product [Heterobilharzia americana]